MLPRLCIGIEKGKANMENFNNELQNGNTPDPKDERNEFETPRGIEISSEIFSASYLSPRTETPSARSPNANTETVAPKRCEI